MHVWEGLRERERDSEGEGEREREAQNKRHGERANNERSSWGGEGAEIDLFRVKT